MDGEAEHAASKIAAGAPTNTRGGRVFGTEEDVLSFQQWLAAAFEQFPCASLYPAITQQAKIIISKWRARLPRKVWLRFVKDNRVLKEINGACATICLRNNLPGGTANRS